MTPHVECSLNLGKSDLEYISDLGICDTQLKGICIGGVAELWRVVDENLQESGILSVMLFPKRHISFLSL